MVVATHLASMLRATLPLLALLLASCSGPAEGGADAGGGDAQIGVDGAGGDGGGGGGGLTFVFVVPGMPDVTPIVSVDELRLGLRDVRAIGDAAPGDARTSIADWGFDLKTDQPSAALGFPAAPPGIYSSFEARLGGSQRFEVRGTVRLASGSRVGFRIENDNLAGQISVSLEGLMLEAAPRTATIRVSLAFLGNVDWNALAHDGDEIEIGSESPAMAGIVSALPGAFSLGPVQ
jgi:hypothetical protein